MTPHTRRDKATWMRKSPKWRTALALMQHGCRMGRSVTLPRRSARWALPAPAKAF